ncbi:hypothetical protein I204_07240 [Kwoniella mangroviensis CBS 8886]|nr:hypothetical protein I204_07240 [Kwoniella mangroviensis CBS 8886]
MKTTIALLGLGCAMIQAQARQYWIVVGNQIALGDGATVNGNQYPQWVVDDGGVSECEPFDDCNKGDINAPGLEYLYETYPETVTMYGSCGRGNVDLYKSGDTTWNAYTSGGDGSVIGTCENDRSWDCLKEELGSWGVKSFIRCQLDW